MEKAFECGYNSDGEQGPFFNAVIDKGALEADKEDIPEIGQLAIAEPTVEPNNGGDVANEHNLSPEIIRKMKLTEIKEALRKRGVKLKPGNKKADFISELIDAVNKNLPVVMNRPSQTPRATNPHALKDFAPTAKWRVLVPSNEVVEEPDNEFNFRAPTIPAEDAEFVPHKQNFDEKFDRQQFNGWVEYQKNHANGRPKFNDQGKPVMDRVLLKGRKGCPSPKFMKKNKLDRNSLPFEWFNAFLPVYDGSCSSLNASNKFWTSKWAVWSNQKAQQYGAGERGGLYKDWKPFTHEDIERMLAIYIIQGLNPSPQLEMKFATQSEDPIQGNDLIASIFGSAGGKRQNRLHISIVHRCIHA